MADDLDCQVCVTDDTEWPVCMVSSSWGRNSEAEEPSTLPFVVDETITKIEGSPVVWSLREKALLQACWLLDFLSQFWEVYCSGLNSLMSGGMEQRY